MGKNADYEALNKRVEALEAFVKERQIKELIEANTQLMFEIEQTINWELKI